MNNTATPLIDELRALVIKSVTEVCETMFGLEAKMAAVAMPHRFGEVRVSGSVGLVGEVNAVFSIHLAETGARMLASRILNLPAEELEAEGMVNDVVGELSNMVAGSVKSHLCDAGAPCALTIPSVVRAKDLGLERTAVAHRRLLGFAVGSEHVQVEVLLQGASDKLKYSIV